MEFFRHKRQKENRPRGNPPHDDGEAIWKQIGMAESDWTLISSVAPQAAAAFEEVLREALLPILRGTEATAIPLAVDMIGLVMDMEQLARTLLVSREWDISDSRDLEQLVGMIKLFLISVFWAGAKRQAAKGPKLTFVVPSDEEAAGEVGDE